MVEIDAQSIADGSLVVIHDDTLDRTTSLSGLVRDMTPAMLASARLRASDGLNGAPLTTTPLPRLPEMLEALRGKGLINIDTKVPADLDAACATVIDMGMTDQVLMKMIVRHDDDGSEFLGRDWFGKVAFMPVILDAPAGALVSSVTRIAQTLAAPMVEIQFRDIEELLNLSGVLAPQHVGIWTNTLDPVHSLDLSDSRAMQDPAAVWGHLLACGVGALQTDQSEALADFLGRGAAGRA
jgi:glycerophosphoryl diester phosphodiesterase